MRKKLRALHYTTRASIGIEAAARSLSFEVSLLIEKLELTRERICLIEKPLVSLVDETLLLRDRWYLLLEQTVQKRYRAGAVGQKNTARWQIT